MSNSAWESITAPGKPRLQALSTWEQRMSHRAAERERARVAALPPEDYSPAGFGAEHEGHHWHLRYWGRDCSCGGLTGVSTYIPPDDIDAWEEQNRCSICGERGVWND